MTRNTNFLNVVFFGSVCVQWNDTIEKKKNCFHVFLYLLMDRFVIVGWLANETDFIYYSFTHFRREHAIFISIYTWTPSSLRLCLSKIFYSMNLGGRGHENVLQASRTYACERARARTTHVCVSFFHWLYDLWWSPNSISHLSHFQAHSGACIFVYNLATDYAFKLLCTLTCTALRREHLSPNTQTIHTVRCVQTNENLKNSIGAPVHDNLTLITSGGVRYVYFESAPKLRAAYVSAK